jgi:predicted short-subunit dehydrogenase-like oxidoreductase (DUF2520 family)
MRDRCSFEKVGIIGTGRVALTLGRLLSSHSAAPALVWGRTPAHCDALIRKLGSADAAEQISELARACDLIMIAVADDALMEIVDELAEVLPAQGSALIFHVSGRSGASMLAALEACGAQTAAIHPVMTFTGDAEADIRHVKGAHFAITTSTPLATVRARNLVDLLGGIAIEIDEDDRLLYHAALSHAANHLVTLIVQASHMLEGTNIREPRAVFAPLVRAALENSIKHGFSALSGPLLRGDRQTISGHLAAVQKECPEVLGSYRAMALATLDEMEREGKPVSSELRHLFD